MFLEDPYEKIEKFRKELDKLFSKYKREVDILTAGSYLQEKARVNIKETKDKYVYEIELPGVRKEDIDLRIEGNTLEVSAAKRNIRKDEEENYLHIEAFAQKFYRMIPLREDIDAKSINARFENGILYVEFKKKKTKKKKKKGKKVAIK